LANAYDGTSGLVITSDQYETKPSVIFRPRIIVSTGSVNLHYHTEKQSDQRRISANQNTFEGQT
jgi:hypothetical protein